MKGGFKQLIVKVVESLKATGFYENTILVFTTDNGGAVKMGGNNMPLRGTKGTLYERGTSTPLYFKQLATQIST